MLGFLFLVLFCGVGDAFETFSANILDIRCEENSEGNPASVSVEDSETIQWVQVGPTDRSALAHLAGIFSTVSLNITSAEPIKVYSHGGWPGEPATLEGWNTKYCDWFLFFSLRKDCQISVPRFGIWAPWGSTHVGVARKSWSASGDTQKSAPAHTITCKTEFFNRGLMLCLGVGVLLFLLAPCLAYSDFARHVTGFAGGSTVILLIITMFLMMEGKKGKKGSVLVLLVGASTMAANWIQDAFISALKEYAFFVAVIMLTGGFLGLLVSLMYPPVEATKNVFSIVLRFVASMFIMAGTSNFCSSLCIIVLLYSMRHLVRCLCACGSAGATSVPADFGDSNDQLFRNDEDQLLRDHEEQVLYHKMGANAPAFIVSGAADYMTQDEYEKEGEDATAQALEELREQLEGNDDYMSKLSPEAQAAIRERWGSSTGGSSTGSALFKFFGVFAVLGGGGWYYLQLTQ